ncbi:MAG: SDR family NAD(P)-dependent oxidoreductase [Verrucomicrobia bacterium]|nr:SDR family NAD(P)-dependent oxidoreductase [Verrucomicrobiota bacterium]
MKSSSLALLGGAAVGAWALGRALRSRYSFRNKVVLISGGSRGLALVLARQLADEGARLALLARDGAELRRAKAELVERGAEVLIIPCDVTVPDQISSAVDKVLGQFGAIDVLINNAGVIEVGPLDHMTREDFEKSLAVHFWATYELTTRVRPHMRVRGGGRIVNISSIGGKIGVPHLAPYCAGKFALTGFSDAARAELARDNIAVTTVAPGLMRTGSHVNAGFKGDHSAEFAWFSFSNAMPLLSMSAERAARKIIGACRRGQPSLTLTFAARLAIAGNAVAPNLTGYAMKIANAVLPSPLGHLGDRSLAGRESRDKEPRVFTQHLNAASVKNNEQPA